VEPAVWHHVAMVFRNASEIAVYWDGVCRSHYVIKGRAFGVRDGGSLEVGPNWLSHPLTLDELMVVDRALSADDITAYLLAVRGLCEIGFPQSDRE